MEFDPNYNESSHFIKNTFKNKILSELINLVIVVILSFTIFLVLGKKIITNTLAKNHIETINEIYSNLAETKNYQVIVTSNYNFLDLDEDWFIEHYILNINDDKEEAYQMFLEARLELLEEIRNDEQFKISNSKFNAIYYATFSLIVFILLFIFEFLIFLIGTKYKNIGMMITKTSLVNLNNNNYPNKFKLLLRLFIIFLFEHLLLRLFFSNFYFLIIILINLTFLLVSKNKTSLHDFFSQTKEIKDEYIGYITE